MCTVLVLPVSRGSDDWRRGVCRTGWGTRTAACAHILLRYAAPVGGAAAAAWALVLFAAAIVCVCQRFRGARTLMAEVKSCTTAARDAGEANEAAMPRIVA